VAIRNDKGKYAEEEMHILCREGWARLSLDGKPANTR
jgi:hypothetical protein